MATRIATILDSSGSAPVDRAKQLLALASRSTVGFGQFNFMAAFDGTGNDRGKVGDGEQTTYVSELQAQTERDRASNPNQASRYYKGVGTGGDQGNLLINDEVDPNRRTGLSSV